MKTVIKYQADIKCTRIAAPCQEWIRTAYTYVQRISQTHRDRYRDSTSKLQYVTETSVEIYYTSYLLQIHFTHNRRTQTHIHIYTNQTKRIWTITNKTLITVERKCKHTLYLSPNKTPISQVNAYTTTEATRPLYKRQHLNWQLSRDGRIYDVEHSRISAVWIVCVMSDNSLCIFSELQSVSEDLACWFGPIPWLLQQWKCEKLMVYL